MDGRDVNTGTVIHDGKPTHRSRTLQALINVDTSTQIPVIQPPLLVDTDHDVPEAHISVEEAGVYK